MAYWSEWSDEYKEELEAEERYSMLLVCLFPV